jgi:hypothetical protein
VNIDANADADALPVFRRASQNLTAAAMLLRGCPEAATSEERRVRQQLKSLLEAAASQKAESSASRQRLECRRAGAPSAHSLNPPPSQHREHGEGGRAVALAVRSRLGPNHNAGTPSNPDGGPRASTTAHATTTTVDTGDDTTATTTVIAAGHRTKEVHGPLARASATRSSLRTSAL